MSEKEKKKWKILMPDRPRYNKTQIKTIIETLIWYIVINGIGECILVRIIFTIPGFNEGNNGSMKKNY